MTALRRFGTFWWDFVVGDDWRVALGVVIALGVTAAVAATGAPAWWILPVVIALLLYISLRGEAQRAARRRSIAAGDGGGSPRPGIDA